MNEREKLVELIRQGYSKGRARQEWDLVENTMADYLLENGIIILPCMVGDTVYIVHNTVESIELDCLKTCIYETIIDSIHISGIVEYHVFYKKLTHPDCDFFSDKDIGKSVFLTKEEAEQAIERRQ